MTATMEINERFVINRMLRKLGGVIPTVPSKKYVAYIRSPAWLQRRREHLAQNPKCQICIRRVAIQVHHWYYGRMGRERPEDLCSVCLDCHHRIHCMALPDPANDNEQLALSFDGNDAA